ncbi:MAG: hypothetical protein WCJ35_01930 [Planctomycetota bacterium]
MVKCSVRKIVGLTAGCLVLLAVAWPASAWEPNEKDLDAAINSGDFGGYFANLNAWLEAKTPADLAKTNEAALTELVKDPAVRKALDQRQFIVTHGVATVNTFAKVEAHRTFLGWVMKSTEILDLYLEAVASNEGLIGDGAKNLETLERWHQLYTEDPDTHKGVYMKLAMAAAAFPPGGAGMYSGEPVNWLKRYYNYKTANEKKELMPSFNHLLVVDYARVLSCIGGDKDIRWARQMIRSWRPDLLEKEQIHKIVSEVWRRFSPFPFDNGFITVMEGGGKCGPRGIFGQFVCNALGIPAIGVGQPRHCCFAARCDFPETEPQVGSVWKVYQGRGWLVSDCGNSTYGTAFVAEMTKRYRTAELSAISHIQWLASVQPSKAKTDALRVLALKVRKSVNTSDPLGVPASEVDVVLAGKRSKADPSHKEPVLDYDKEGPAATNEFASAGGSKTPRGKEEPIVVPPGVIHVEAETFSAKSPGVTVYDCTTGGKQVNFHKSIDSSWLDYVIDVPEMGTYSLEVMLAAANRDMVLNVSSGTEKLGAVSIPGTIGLWKKMAPVDIKLSKGRQTLRISAPFQRGVAVQWFELTPKK